MSETLICNPGGRDLLVMLPGAYMKAVDYLAAGFTERLAIARPTVTLALADLALGEMADGSALATVDRDLLQPARLNYRRVWLGGISLGGLLALCHAVDCPASVDGLCLIAPYPGSRLTTLAIDRAGGLADWTPDATQRADPEFRVWHWLKAPPAELPVFVGHGREDRFAAGMQRIAERFPADRRHVVEGDHDWPAWQRLWDHFIADDRFFA